MQTSRPMCTRVNRVLPDNLKYYNFMICVFNLFKASDNEFWVGLVCTGSLNYKLTIRSP